MCLCFGQFRLKVRNEECGRIHVQWSYSKMQRDSSSNQICWGAYHCYILLQGWRHKKLPAAGVRTDAACRFTTQTAVAVAFQVATKLVKKQRCVWGWCPRLISLRHIKAQICHILPYFTQLSFQKTVICKGDCWYPMRQKRIDLSKIYLRFSTANVNQKLLYRTTTKKQVERTEGESDKLYKVIYFKCERSDEELTQGSLTRDRTIATCILAVFAKVRIGDSWGIDRLLLDGFDPVDITYWALFYAYVRSNIVGFGLKWWSQVSYIKSSFHCREAECNAITRFDVPFLLANYEIA